MTHLGQPLELLLPLEVEGHHSFALFLAHAGFPPGWSRPGLLQLAHDPSLLVLAHPVAHRLALIPAELLSGHPEPRGVLVEDLRACLSALEDLGDKWSRDVHMGGWVTTAYVCAHRRKNKYIGDAELLAFLHTKHVNWPYSCPKGTRGVFVKIANNLSRKGEERRRKPAALG